MFRKIISLINRVFSMSAESPFSISDDGTMLYFLDEAVKRAQVADPFLKTRIPDLRELSQKYVLDEQTVRIVYKVIKNFKLKKPLLLEGETATSKTSAVMFASALLGLPVERVNFSRQTDLSELIGKYVPNSSAAAKKLFHIFHAKDIAGYSRETRAIIEKYRVEHEGIIYFKPLDNEEDMRRVAQLEDIRLSDKPFVWQEGVLPSAMKKGCLLLLDEMNLMPAGLLAYLNPVLEDNPQLYIPQTGEKISRGHGLNEENFFVVATQNPTTYEGRNKLPSDLLRRFGQPYIVDMPTQKEINEMLMFLIHGIHPEIEINGESYQAERVKPVFPELAQCKDITMVLGLLSRFHFEVQHLLQARVLNRNRKQKIVFSRRDLFDVLSFMVNFNKDVPRESFQARPLDVLTKAVELYYLNRFVVSDSDHNRVRTIKQRVFSTGEVSNITFAGIGTLGESGSQRIWDYLKEKGYLDESHHVTQKLQDDQEPLVTWLKAEYKNEKDQIMEHLMALQSAPLAFLKAAQAQRVNAQQRPCPVFRYSEDGKFLFILDQKLPVRTDLTEEDKKYVPSLKEVNKLCMDHSTLAHIYNLAVAVNLGQPVLTEGPTATCKTKSILYLAHLLNQPVIRFNLSGQTETSELIGKFVPSDRTLAERYEEILSNRDYITSQQTQRILQSARNASRPLSLDEARQIAQLEGLNIADTNWIWMNGPLPVAIEKGYWLIEDEINQTNSDVLERQNPVLERNRSFTVTENGGQHFSDADGTIGRHFMLFATMNPAEYHGKKPLSAAFVNRWTLYLQLREPSEADLLQMLEFLAYGTQPEVTLNGKKFQAEHTEPRFSKLSNLIGMESFYEQLARFHAALSLQLSPNLSKRTLAKDSPDMVLTRSDLIEVLERVEYTEKVVRETGKEGAVSLVTSDILTDSRVRKNIILQAMKEVYLDKFNSDEREKISALMEAHGFSEDTWAYDDITLRLPPDQAAVQIKRDLKETFGTFTFSVEQFDSYAAINEELSRVDTFIGDQVSDRKVSFVKEVAKKQRIEDHPVIADLIDTVFDEASRLSTYRQDLINRKVALLESEVVLTLAETEDRAKSLQVTPVSPETVQDVGEKLSAIRSDSYRIKLNAMKIAYEQTLDMSDPRIAALLTRIDNAIQRTREQLTEITAQLIQTEVLSIPTEEVSFTPKLGNSFDALNEYGGVFIDQKALQKLGIDLESSFKGLKEKKAFGIKSGILVNIDPYQQLLVLEAILDRFPHLVDRLGFFNVQLAQAACKEQASDTCYLTVWESFDPSKDVLDHELAGIVPYGQATVRAAAVNANCAWKNANFNLFSIDDNSQKIKQYGPNTMMGLGIRFDENTTFDPAGREIVIGDYNMLVWIAKELGYEAIPLHMFTVRDSMITEIRLDRLNSSNRTVLEEKFRDLLTHTELKLPSITVAPSESVEKVVSDGFGREVGRQQFNALMELAGKLGYDELTREQFEIVDGRITRIQLERMTPELASTYVDRFEANTIVLPSIDFEQLNLAQITTESCYVQGVRIRVDELKALRDLAASVNVSRIPLYQLTIDKQGFITDIMMPELTRRTAEIFTPRFAKVALEVPAIPVRAILQQADTLDDGFGRKVKSDQLSALMRLAQQIGCTTLAPEDFAVENGDIVSIRLPGITPVVQDKYAQYFVPGAVTLPALDFSVIDLKADVVPLSDTCGRRFRPNELKLLRELAYRLNLKAIPLHLITLNEDGYVTQLRLPGINRRIIEQFERKFSEPDVLYLPTIKVTQSIETKPLIDDGFGREVNREEFNALMNLAARLGYNRLAEEDFDVENGRISSIQLMKATPEVREEFAGFFMPDVIRLPVIDYDRFSPGSETYSIYNTGGVKISEVELKQLRALAGELGLSRVYLHQLRVEDQQIKEIRLPAMTRKLQRKYQDAFSRDTIIRLPVIPVEESTASGNFIDDGFGRSVSSEEFNAMIRLAYDAGLQEITMEDFSVKNGHITRISFYEITPAIMEKYEKQFTAGTIQLPCIDFNDPDVRNYTPEDTGGVGIRSSSLRVLRDLATELGLSRVPLHYLTIDDGHVVSVRLPQATRRLIEKYNTIFGSRIMLLPTIDVRTDTSDVLYINDGFGRNVNRAQFNNLMNLACELKYTRLAKEDFEVTDGQITGINLWRMTPQYKASFKELFPGEIIKLPKLDFAVIDLNKPLVTDTCGIKIQTMSLQLLKNLLNDLGLTEIPLHMVAVEYELITKVYLNKVPREIRKKYPDIQFGNSVFLGLFSRKGRKGLGRERGKK